MSDPGIQNEVVVEVKRTVQNREYWSNREWLSQNKRTSAANADVLLVPLEGLPNGVAFPAGSVDFYRFVKARLPDELKLEAASPNSHKERHLRHSMVEFATIVVTAFALPVMVNLVSEYIKIKFINPNNKDTIEIKLVSENHEFHYKGPAHMFKKHALTLTEDQTKPTNQKEENTNIDNYPQLNASTESIQNTQNNANES